MKERSIGDYIFIILSILFTVSVFALLHEMFNRNINNFTNEILAAVLGSIIIVASMAIMLRIEARQEREKEFSGTLFQHKIQIYEKLLKAIFEADDDNVITKGEVQKIENLVGMACMVANEDLVSRLSQFIYQFKVYGVMYFRSMTTTQKEHFIALIEQEVKKEEEVSVLAFEKHALEVDVRKNPEAYFLSLDELIQGIRNDLSVVDGDIRQSVEHFVRINYNEFGFMEIPSIVDGQAVNENDFETSEVSETSDMTSSSYASSKKKRKIRPT